jgi:biotin carboxylase
LKKLIIIGANNFQLPLILKAKEMGIETHVFAWENGAVGKTYADYFYPISITDKDQILEIATKIKPDGVLSIGSDLASITVNHIAHNLGLTGNSPECTLVTTNKFIMRQLLTEKGLPCPLYRKADQREIPDIEMFSFPIIVKPTDRSGSRGVTKVETKEDFETAINRAIEESFAKEAIVEEFIEGLEYSVEMISWKGNHYFLQITEKETTGPPYFVEMGQHQPARFDDELQNKIQEVIKKTLTALGIENGASHSEIKITPDGEIFIIEIGARMGGDYIGSHLVRLSTGYDFVKGVIEVALGVEPKIIMKETFHAGIYFLIASEGTVQKIENHTSKYKEIKQNEVFVKPGDRLKYPVKESAQRSGYFIYQSKQTLRIKNPESIINIITISEQ